MKPAAVLLAGGTARRMGGGDKSLLPLGGRPILAHVVERLQPQVSALALNANGDPARFAGWALPVIPDAIAGYPGPLAGIHAGMVWTRETLPHMLEILSAPTDLPFLPIDLAECLHAARLAGGADIVIAASGGRTHPAIALWPVALAEALHHGVVHEGLRKVTDFQGRYRVVTVDFPLTDVDPFFNVNTPEDLEQAQAAMG